MPESVTPLVAVGVVIVLFIVLLSVLTNNYSLNGIKLEQAYSMRMRHITTLCSSARMKAAAHATPICAARTASAKPFA